MSSERSGACVDMAPTRRHQWKEEDMAKVKTFRSAAKGVLCALGLSIGAAGCSLAGDPSISGGAIGVEPSSYEPALSPSIAHLGVCADPSASVDPAFLDAAMDGLADVVRDLPLPSESTGASEAVPGLDIVVRQVSSGSFGSADDELIRIEIPGIPGLVAAPDSAEYETFPERSRRWREASDERAAAAERAASERELLLQQLSGMSVEGRGSEIAGCITALRDSFPGGAEVTIVLATDLDQTGEPQLRGDYANVGLLVVHWCSDASDCDSQQAEWRSVFDQMDLRTADFTTVSRLPADLATMLEVS